MDHANCVGLNHGWKKMGFQLVLNKTFCSKPQPLTHRRLKLRQRKKTKETMFSVPPPPPPPLSPLLIDFPHKIHNIRIEKQMSISF